MNKLYAHLTSIAGVRRPLRRWQRFAMCLVTCFVLSAQLLGCGPGTGGSGTGPDAGASVAPGGSPEVARALLAGAWGGGDVVAVFEPQGVGVTSMCSAFQYVGAWQVDAAGGLVLTMRAVGQSSPLAAAPPDGASGGVRLEVVPVVEGAVGLTIRDSSGRLLVGPTVLRPLESTPALSAPAC